MMALLWVILLVLVLFALTGSALFFLVFMNFEDMIALYRDVRSRLERLNGNQVEHTELLLAARAENQKDFLHALADRYQSLSERPVLDSLHDKNLWTGDPLPSVWLRHLADQIPASPREETS